MKDLIAKLTVGIKDPDTKKVLESIGITKDFISGVEVIEKPETLDDALKNFNFKGEFDRRITKAINTNEDTLKEKFEFVPKEQKKDDKKDDAAASSEDKDNPMMQAIAALQAKLDKLEEDKKAEATKSVQTKALELLKSKNIPDVYVSKFDLDKPLEDQVEAIETEFNSVTENLIKSRNPNIKLPNPPKPGTNKLNAETVEKFKKIF